MGGFCAATHAAAAILTWRTSCARLCVGEKWEPSASETVLVFTAEHGLRVGELQLLERAHSSCITHGTGASSTKRSAKNCKTKLYVQDRNRKDLNNRHRLSPVSCSQLLRWLQRNLLSVEGEAVCLWTSSCCSSCCRNVWICEFTVFQLRTMR